MKVFMTRKALGFSVVLIVLSLSGGYYILGGFNSVLVETIEVSNYHLVGRYFEGSYKSDTIGMFFEEMRGYLNQGKLNGQIAIIYDQEPSGARGKAKGFIGICLQDSLATYSEDLEKRIVHAHRSIRVSKNAHISVMPNPDAIARNIQEYATIKDLEIGELSIEIYYPNSRLVIERPITD